MKKVSLLISALFLFFIFGLFTIALASSTDGEGQLQQVVRPPGKQPFVFSGKNPLGSLVRSWNSNGPYFTVFDLDTPQILPNLAFFPAGFITAGEFVNGLSYMVDITHMVYEVNDEGTILDQYAATSPPGGQTYSGLALDTTDGMVYASSTSGSVSTLFTFDVLTGNAVQIGPINGSPANMAIAVDGVGNLFGFDVALDSFMQIDKATGATSNLVTLPFDANFNQGMGYDPATGLLFILGVNNATFNGELWTVDTNNPAVPVFAFVGLLGSVDPGGTNQLTWGGTMIEEPTPTPTTVPPTQTPPPTSIPPTQTATPAGPTPTPSPIAITPTPTPAIYHYLPRLFWESG